MSSSDGRRPRQNPVFMFLPSGVKNGSRTVFSVPGATAEEGQRATILKENLVIPACPGSPKKRGRHLQPPLPFRLPTEEEDKLYNEKGVEGSSKGDHHHMIISPSHSGKFMTPSRKKNLDVKPSNIQLIKKFFLSSVENEELTISTLDSTQQFDGLVNNAELEKCLRWVRFQGPEIFWSTIHKNFTKTHDEWKCFETIHAASTTTALKFMSVVEKHLKLGESLQGKEMQFINFLRKTLTGILLVSDKQKEIPGKIVDEFLDKFYTCGFRAMMNVNKIKASKDTLMDVDVEPGDVEPCEGCLDHPCICSKVGILFQESNLALQGLGLMDELAGPRLFSIMKRDMADKITKTGTDQVDVSHLGGLLDWLEKRTTVWIDTIYPRLPQSEETLVKSQLEKDLRLMMLEQYGKSIIKDLFTVIIEFPESQPLLDDLKHCMKEVNLRKSVVNSLKSSLERRLLNAGVNTSEVLEAYIATVRALKYVDPSGILVQLVTPPVREYLKHREETVRVILISLTDETGELSEELARNPTNPDKSNKITLANWKNWEPDPIDVPKDKHNLRKSDLIEALVSIYGSKTVFIDEYRALLADRLLRSPKPGSITREIKCLELLKLRFGESDLQKCEVMLKDVSDSLRLNTRFYEEDGAVLANEAVLVTGLIVSAQFWPSFKQEELQLPKPVQAALEKYTKAFEMIKGNRTLEWQKHIGTVELEIELGDSQLTFTVTPIQATLIYHFQEKDKWTIDELAEITGTTSVYLASRIGFWVSKGIIVYLGQGTYALADSISESSKATGIIPNKYVEEGESDSPMASTSSQRATELQVFWSYIEAMLTNLESLPLARIHSMLKLFATVECSSEELQKFLDDKVSQNLLVYSAGQYQLPK